MNIRSRAAWYAAPLIVSTFALLGLATTAKTAQAQTIGYTFVINGNTNTPTFTLTNNATGGSGITLTGVTLTIGSTLQNFDAAYVENAGATGIGFTRLSPDNNDSGGLRADFLQYTFTGFDATESFNFQGDIDDDNVDSTEDYRIVLFNNGAAIPNAQLTVNFSNGGSLTQTFADQTAGQNAYTFSQNTSVTAAPEPGTLALLALGMLPVAGTVLRRRRKA